MANMVEKPTTGDEEQRRHQTRVARIQSGLPPEDPAEHEDPGTDASPGEGEKQDAQPERES